jgi:hypothetical protein
MTALAGMALASPAHALDYKATLEAEGRAFFEADGQPIPAAGSATLEFFHAWDNEHQRITGELFGRYDAEDDARTHDDVRELFWQVIGEDFEFRLGARRVYWGVVESRHLVDIVNQTDLVEDIDSKSKLGAPMMNLALVRDWGTLDFMLLPYARARTFPGPEGRPRLPFPVNANEALYESRQGQHHLDYATRYAGSFGPLDFGVAWFDGTARDPHLLPCLRRGSGLGNSASGPDCNFAASLGAGNTPAFLIPILQALGQAPTEQQVRDALVLVPYYDRLRQASLDAQFVAGSLALKLEALHRERSGNGSAAAVGGFEYSFGNVPPVNADVGVLGEYLWDQDNEGLGVLFDDQVFVGTRVAFNDEASSSVLAGVTGDRRNFRTRFGGVEANRRIGEDWRVSLKARLFAEIPDDSIAKFVEKQDFVTVSLERFF